MKLRNFFQFASLCWIFASSPLQGADLIVRGPLLHFLSDPFETSTLEEERKSYQYLEDGVLWVSSGKIKAMGSFASLKGELPKDATVAHFPDSIITPGFIDTHIHYPQTDMIASYGEQLLEWLETYTFPTEKKFTDAKYARDVSKFFLNELLKNGTTTALIFGTVHKTSVDALFAEAEKKQMRVVAGKVLMDRNAPEYLRDTPQSAYSESKALIESWHKKPGTRLLYAVTPRFAPTSSPEQLNKAGQLKSEFPDVFVHTHLSENKKEVQWVSELFPESKGYLDVYDRAGLLSRRSVFAHGIHLTDSEISRLSKSGSSVSFCPTSNLFLGSGLFRLMDLKKANVLVGMGTDVGAGTSFSMLQTQNEAYKVVQLQGQKLSAFKALYLATLGGAKALDLDSVIGNFSVGKEADFIVLDLKATPLIARRLKGKRDLAEKLFVLQTLGDDRAVRATFVNGSKVYPAK